MRCYLLDGLPRSRMIELYGASGAGKSTFATLLCTQAQKEYPEEMVLYIDCEQAFNMDYAIALGLDVHPEKFLMIQPDDGVQALQIYQDAIETGLFSLAVVDSIPALITKQELEGDVGQVHMAPLARLLSQTFKTIITTGKQTNTCMLFINQIRANLGFGGDISTPGGNAVKFYPSLRMEIKRIGLLTKGDENIGQTVRVNLVKNRFGAPYKKTDINIYFGKGINKNEEILEVSLEKSIIKRGGAYYTIPLADGDTHRVMGKDAVGEYLDSNPDQKLHLERLVIEAIKPKKGTVEELPETVVLESEE